MRVWKLLYNFKKKKKICKIAKLMNGLIKIKHIDKISNVFFYIFTLMCVCVCVYIYIYILVRIGVTFGNITPLNFFIKCVFWQIYFRDKGLKNICWVLGLV